MMTSRILIRLAAGVFVAISTTLLAVATILLGWIITAHASNLIHDQNDDEKGPAACERSIEAFCSPTFPIFVTKPATLVVTPHRSTNHGMRGHPSRHPASAGF